jgi:hypothetical protein
MNWWLILAVIWLGLDLLIVATAWYAITFIKPRYQAWWKRVVVDDEPNAVRFRKSLRH